MAIGAEIGVQHSTWEGGQLVHSDWMKCNPDIIHVSTNMTGSRSTLEELLSSPGKVAVTPHPYIVA